MRFSHSSLSDYQACAKMYKIKRIDRITTIRNKSPLFFGGALDDASEAILLRYKNDLSESQKQLSKRSAFLVFSKIMEPYKKTLKATYSVADLQMELLTDSDWDDIKAYAIEKDLIIEDYETFILDCKAMKKSDELPLNMDYVQCYMSFISLHRKAEMMLDVLESWCAENIKEVHSIQERISLQDDEDELMGFLDFEATLLNGERRVIDLKTSAKAYKEGEASVSQQLTIYSEAVNNPLVAFLVLQKNIRKRDPRVKLQFITGEITEEQSNKVFDDITEVVYDIKNVDYYLPNKNSCWSWGKCSYYDLCHKNSMKGLIKKDEK